MNVSGKEKPNIPEGQYKCILLGILEKRLQRRGYACSEWEFVITDGKYAGEHIKMRTKDVKESEAFNASVVETDIALRGNLYYVAVSTTLGGRLIKAFAREDRWS